MLLFCEGTRFTPDKHKASMEIAKQKGLPVLKHHLLPRTRGFIQCAQSMKSHFKYIYDVTVCFNMLVAINFVAYPSYTPAGYQLV